MGYLSTGIYLRAGMLGIYQTPRIYGVISGITGRFYKGLPIVILALAHLLLHGRI